MADDTAGRNAYICSHKDCIPPFRVFLAPGETKPQCSVHGNTMQRQANQPYMQPGGSGKPKRVTPRRPKAKSKENVKGG